MDYQIITFYEFRKLAGLVKLKESLLKAMAEDSILGTVILAEEGFNATVCGEPAGIACFVSKAGELLAGRIDIKSSFSERMVFQRRKVRIKPEIITLGKKVDMQKRAGTHVNCREWNAIISDPETIVLDTRNDYEVQLGTFRNAVNPQTLSFRELPDFAEMTLDPQKHKRIAMFCTGGIRCEKFAPYLRQKGFEEIYQLQGGILRYLAEVGEDESLWQGECFVFDERISLDEKLEPGSGIDLSLAAKPERRND